MGWFGSSAVNLKYLFKYGWTECRDFFCCFKMNRYSTAHLSQTSSLCSPTSASHLCLKHYLLNRFCKDFWYALFGKLMYFDSKFLALIHKLYIHSDSIIFSIKKIFLFILIMDCTGYGKKGFWNVITRTWVSSVSYFLELQDTYKIGELNNVWDLELFCFFLFCFVFLQHCEK